MPRNARWQADNASSRSRIIGSAGQTTESAQIEVPLLPLTGNVVFPRSIYPLTLKGSQAVELINAAVTANGIVGLFLQRDLAADPPAPDDLHRVGTLARLEDIQVSKSGEISFTAIGLTRVGLREIVQWEPFVLARLQPLAVGQEEVIAPLFQQVRDLYTGLLATNPDAASAMQEALEHTSQPEELAYLVAATLPLSPSAKQAILELDSSGEKLVQLVPLLTRAHEINATRLSEQRAAENAEGGPHPASGAISFSDQTARTSANALSRDPLLLDLIELENKLHQAKLPAETRRTVERELDRLTSLAPSSPDYSIVRGYLQCLADLPWQRQEEPALDLDVARSILDRDHYGLLDVKERILEYLAVRKLRNRRREDIEENSAVSPPGDPILCLVGPPGIGKTSLGRSVADALGRPFVRVSLGGISEESEIRGHRRTYVGAMPGKIIQAFARTSSNQPVIMLDEIDKIGSGGKGDPTSALLEVLDSEQQRTFLDHYLDVPFDLSQVFFIATANMLDNVPPALRDRLEVIQLSGYIEEEKVQIAVRHIIPRQLEWHALTEKDIQWEEDAILGLVRNYTREAGVRQLEREIATLCRRVAALVAQDEGGRPQVVDTDFVCEVLGAPRYVPELPETSGQPGMVTGVVWTPVGGDIIHVEASIMPGSKVLTITGQLGEIMRESAQAAVSYVRAEAVQLGIDPDFFEHRDIHLHVPSGAVPKDGPSAGITMATALVSLLTGRAVPPDTAMTGEITLRGRVLPVGGIKEKILAARRAGIQLLILPSSNRRDLEAISSDLLEGIDFAFADSMVAVIQAAFSRSEQPEGQGSRRAPKRTRAISDDSVGEMPRAAKRR